MKIRTEILQKLVSKAIQGSSNNRMIPISSLIGIEAKGDILTLTTTDGSNIFKVNQNIEVDGQIAVSNEFYTIVNADIFAKLVGKTTTEYITLENKENYLEFRGNGTNKFEIAINEEGEMIRFLEIKELDVEPYSMSINLLQSILRTAKVSVAKTMELPCLTGYYIFDKTISTNRQLIFQSDVGLSKKPLLISSEMAELLLLVDGETINVLHKDNDLIFFNETFMISGKELEGKENYPVQPIIDALKLNYNKSIKVNKQELLAVLDRMELFVSEYDKNGVFLNFDTDNLVIQSQKSNAVEIINYIEGIDVSSFNCLIDIDMLKSQVETISTDVVEIAYGQKMSIKLIDGNCIYIISLLEKSN